MSNISHLKRPDYTAQGVSGTDIQGGRILDPDDTSDLVDLSTRISTFREMLRSDSVVRAATKAKEHTLLSASWTFEVPDGSSVLARQAADQLNMNFGFNGNRGRLRAGWEACLRRALRFDSFGFQYLETMFEVDDGKVWLTDLADRKQSAHNLWLVDDAGNLTGVEQRTPAGAERTIDAEKLLLFVADQEGQGYEGLGALRPCWFPWRLKAHTLRMLGVGVERWALGTPTACFDYDALRTSAEYAEKDIAVLVTDVQNQLKSYVSNELGFLTTPAGVELDVFGSGVLDAAGPLSVVQECDRLILMGFLLQFLLLGVNDTGSRSVGEVQESFFGRANVNILDHIASVVSAPAGPGLGVASRLTAWNFPALDPAEYPVLEHHGLREDPLMESLGVLAALVAPGLLTPGKDIESALRARLGLPMIESTA